MNEEKGLYVLLIILCAVLSIFLYKDITGAQVFTQCDPGYSLHMGYCVQDVCLHQKVNCILENNVMHVPDCTCNTYYGSWMCSLPRQPKTGVKTNLCTRAGELNKKCGSYDETKQLCAANVIEHPRGLNAPSGGITGGVVITPAVVTLTSISPDNVSQASVLEYTLTGTEFNSSAVVSTANPDVSVGTPALVDDTTLLVNMTVAANASTGAFDVTVTQDTDSSTLPGALTVYEGPFDPASLINVSAGYFPFNLTTNTTEPVNLTYNITTAPGVEKSSVNITGSYLEVTDLNTSNVTVINLTNVTDPEGTFTLQFEEHAFTEEGTYSVEVHLDLNVNGEDMEREYYGPYFGVGAPTCNLVPPCVFTGVVGVTSSITVNIVTATLPILLCQLTTPPLGCIATPGPASACTITCNSASAGVFNSGLIARDSISFCVPFPPTGLPCTFTFVSPTPTPTETPSPTPTSPPAPAASGGGGGGYNSYPGGAICPTYCKEARYASVAVCSSPACQAIANIGAGTPPGVTYSGPSPRGETVPPVYSPPKNVPINIAPVPVEHRTVALPGNEPHPPTVPIEQLPKYRTLQTQTTITQRIVNFIENLFVPTPEIQAPVYFTIETQRLGVKREQFEEWQGDIMILKNKAAVHPLPPVIGPAMNAQPQIAVGPDDIITVVNR